MIAHLPMYDTPENAAAHGRLWAAFRTHLSDAPQDLSTSDDLLASWMDPNLLLSQTCGLPLRAKLWGKVQVIGTPDNRLDGCPPGHYRSAIIARKGSGISLDHNDFTFAYNDPISQSGWGAPFAAGITGAHRIESGGHRLSAEMVADGTADVAAIDALTWHFLKRDWPDASTLEVLAWTSPTPTLPFITSLSQDAAGVRTALRQAIAALSDQDKDQLCLYGLVDVPLEAYEAFPIPPAP